MVKVNFTAWKENKHNNELLEAIEYLLSDMNLSRVPIKCVQRVEKAITKAKKEINMKLEVGKYYKTRNGRKCKCVHIFKVEGVNSLCSFDEENISRTYYNNGMYNLNSQGGIDIVSEWVEPVEHEMEVLAYRYKGNIYLTYGAHLNAIEKERVGEKIAKIKVKFTEGEGL